MRTIAVALSAAFKTLRPLVEDLYFVRLLGLAADVCVSRILLMLRERAGKGLKFSLNEAKRLEGDVAVINKCFSEAKLLLHNGYVHNSLLSRQMQCLFDTCDLILLAMDEHKDKDGNASDHPSSSASSPLLALMRMLARKYNFLAASPLAPSSPPTESTTDTTTVAYNYLTSIAVLRPDASAATVSLASKIVAQQRQHQRTKTPSKVISFPFLLKNK